MTSLYFEDLEIGREFETGLSRPITDSMIESYFQLTGDRFNIHRDHDYARFFGLPAAMVPGNLVVAIATGLVFEAGYFTDSLVVQARKDTTFLKPLFIGERIRVVERVLAVEDRPSKRYGKVVLERLVLNEANELIQRVEQDYRIVKKDALAEAAASALVRAGSQ